MADALRAPATAPGAATAATAPIPLGPLDFIDILDGAFTLLRAQAWPILGLTATALVPLQLAASFLQRDALSTGLAAVFNDPLASEALIAGDLSAGTIAAAFLGLLTTSLLVPLLSGAISLMGIEAMLGREQPLRDALRSAVRRGVGLVGGWWLHALVILAPAVPALLLALLAAVLGGGAVTVLLFVAVPAAVVGAVLVMPLVSLVTPAVMAEGAGGVTAVRRSLRLARPRYGSLLGATVGTGLVYTVIATVLSSLPSLVGFAVGGGFAWVLVAVGTIISQAITIPLIALAATLMYLDARCRVEGLDVSLRVALLRTPSS